MVENFISRRTRTLVTSQQYFHLITGSIEILVKGYSIKGFYKGSVRPIVLVLDKLPPKIKI